MQGQMIYDMSRFTLTTVLHRRELFRVTMKRPFHPSVCPPEILSRAEKLRFPGRLSVSIILKAKRYDVLKS